MEPNKIWYVVANPRDESLKPYPGAPVRFITYTSNTRELVNVFALTIYGATVRMTRADNVADFTQQEPAKPYQPELLVMSEITDGLKGFATFKKVWCLIDALNDTVAFTLSESLADTLVQTGHTGAVRHEQHWCIEVGGNHYGLTGTEPLEFVS